jgi:hypothetical protein
MRLPRGEGRRRSRGERGASAIEMAIVAPSFLLLIFVIVEVALWMHARDVALAAAQEGVAELRTVSPGDDQSTITDDMTKAALETAHDLGIIRNPSAESSFGEPDGRVSVTVSGDVLDLIPGWTLHVSGTATGHIEDFNPDYGPPPGEGE